ncbi:5676_t:CDS:2 [Diversispora eburnea]|uniref:5676_t:CDS:1 n=2 Tax=Diversisporales TaxID=214509 RepID=A0A9N8V014_9GLOM|nr:5676_t:CDS:2 [Diversispora eburnea]CAG8763155.1 11626_t:CDS:2 [Dentiscutata erythropus]
MTFSTKSISLKSLLNQLNTEFIEESKQLVPKVSDDSEYNEKILNDELQSKANEMQTFKFMRVAKQLEISLSKIILDERQCEKISLQKEIDDLQRKITQQKEVIVKYTSLVRQWSKEFSELEEEHMISL